LKLFFVFIFNSILVFVSFSLLCFPFFVSLRIEEEFLGFLALFFHFFYFLNAKRMHFSFIPLVRNISFVFPLFFHSFWSSKFQKMKFVFLILLFLIFQFFFPIFLFKKNLVYYICAYLCNFWGLVYIFQILYIYVYHVFNV
jgi:hypothetical protein